MAIFPNRIVTAPPFLPQPPLPAQLEMQAVPTNFPGSAPQIYAEGFTNVIDLKFDAAGNLYVLEIDANGLLVPEVTGRLARINAGTQSVVTIASQGLVMPGGMVIGPDGAIYVSNYSVMPGLGQVVRIQP